MKYFLDSFNRVSCVATFCLLVASSTSVWAGSLATTNLALNDGFGPDAGRWHGSATIVASVFGDTLTAEVDWAAFAPGPKFQLYLDGEGIAQSNPAAPGEVIYVYQIVSVTAASPGIDTLTVGVDASDVRGSLTAPSSIPTGAATEHSPASGGDNTTSMAWFFNGTELHPGDTSSLLIFTSPFAPELDFLQVNSGLAGPIPSPLVASISDRIFQFDIPEPNTLALSLLSLLGLLQRTKKTR